MKTRHVWTKTPGKFEEKSDETGMPRIDGTSKSKRLENPGHPQTLPGDKEPPSVFCFNHPLLAVLVFKISVLEVCKEYRTKQQGRKGD